MNTFDRRTRFTRSLATVLRGVAVAAPLLLGAVSAHAASSCDATRTSSFDARLAAKAGEGSEALRRFVTRTQPVYQFDVQGTLARAARLHEAATGCTINVATRS